MNLSTEKRQFHTKNNKDEVKKEIKLNFGKLNYDIEEFQPTMCNTTGKDQAIVR